MLEDFIIKYFWGAAGMLITALPVFFEVGRADQRATDFGTRTEGTLLMADPIASFRLLLSDLIVT